MSSGKQIKTKPELEAETWRRIEDRIKRRKMIRLLCANAKVSEEAEKFLLDGL